MRNISKNKKILFLIVSIVLLIIDNGYCQEKILSLEECLNIAEKNNFELTTQQYKIKEATSKYNQEVSNILPQLDVNLSYFRYDWQPPSKKSLFGASLDDYYAELSLKQVLFGGGKYIARIDSAQYSLAAETVKYDQIRNTIYLSVKKAYYEQLRAQFALKTQQKLIDKLNEQYKISQLLYNSGKTTNLDVLKIQTQIAAAEDAIDNLKNLVYTKALLLGQIMGSNEPVNASFILPAIRENMKINTNCIDNQFKENPELKYINNLVKKSEYDIAVESGEMYPTLFLRGNYYFEDKVFFPGNPNWYVGLGLSFPIYHGGAIASKIEQAVYRNNQLVETQKQIRLGLAVRFQSARATVIDKLNRLKTTKKVLDLSKEALIAAELKYNVGKITATELLDAQTVWLNSELNYFNNIIDVQISLAEIENICPKAISWEAGE